MIKITYFCLLSVGVGCPRVIIFICFILIAQAGYTQTTVKLLADQSEKLTVEITDKLSFDNALQVDLGDSLSINGGNPPYSVIWKSGSAVLSESTAFEVTPSVVPLRLDLTVTDSHNCIVVKPVVILIGTEEEQMVKVKVYPVPATSFITIDPENTKIRATLFNLGGIPVWEQTFAEKRTIQLDISPGTYILEIIQNSMRSVRKIIITSSR